VGVRDSAGPAGTGGCPSPGRQDLCRSRRRQIDPSGAARSTSDGGLGRETISSQVSSSRVPIIRRTFEAPRCSNVSSSPGSRRKRSAKRLDRAPRSMPALGSPRPGDRSERPPALLIGVALLEVADLIRNGAAVELG